MLKIKEIRSGKNVTQDEISVAIGVSKRSFIDYETGKTDIPVGKLQKIATYLQVTINDLLGIEQDHAVVADSPDYYYTKQPSVVTVDKSNNDNIVLVPQKLKAGYLAGWDDPRFISTLPSYRMPGLNNGVFRMFPVEGNSMFPTLTNNSYVVGQFVENWITGIKDNRLYVIISNEVEDGLVKRCINRIKKYNNLICKSDNRRNYPTQNIDPSTIKEVWEVKLHLNFDLPDPGDLYDRMNDLEAELEEIKRNRR